MISNQFWFLLYLIVSLMQNIVIGIFVISTSKEVIILYFISIIILFSSYVSFTIEIKLEKIFFTILFMMTNAFMLFELINYLNRNNMISKDVILIIIYIIQSSCLFISTVSLFKITYN